MKTERNPLVCVCVPTYNAERTLTDTLESILGQTYKNINLFIVDNASTDKTLDIAGHFAAKDPRVKIFRHSENIGAEGNFTRCIHIAGGEYTAIYHADDIYTPTMVEEEVDFLEKHRSSGAVFSMAVSIAETGREIKHFRLPSELALKNKEEYGFAEIFRAWLKYGSFLFCPGAMVRTGIYKDEIRTWDPDPYATSADADVWLKILQKHDVGIIDKPLLRYRVSAASISYHSARGKTGRHDMFRVLDDYIKGPARGFIGGNELKDYALLLLKDDINRSFNLLLSGGRNEISPLLRGLFHPGNIFHALKSSTHIKVLLSGYLVYLLAFIPLNEKIKKILFRTRFKV